MSDDEIEIDDYDDDPAFRCSRCGCVMYPDDDDELCDDCWQEDREEWGA